MEKKPLKKLKLKKSIISQLSVDEQAAVKGGFTTSGNCTGFLCCNGPGASNDAACCSAAGLYASCP